MSKTARTIFVDNWANKTEFRRALPLLTLGGFSLVTAYFYILGADVNLFVEIPKVLLYY